MGELLSFLGLMYTGDIHAIKLCFFSCYSVFYYRDQDPRMVPGAFFSFVTVWNLLKYHTCPGAWGQEPGRLAEAGKGKNSYQSQLSQISVCRAQLREEGEISFPDLD